jgi:circadian clock protein KaiC
LREVYIGPEGVLTGSARLAQEAKEKAAQLLRQQEMSRRSREADRRRREISTQIAVLQAQLEEDEVLSRQAIESEDRLAADRLAMASTRQATPSVKSAAKLSSKGNPRLVQK